MNEAFDSHPVVNTITYASQVRALVGTSEYRTNASYTERRTLGTNTVARQRNTNHRSVHTSFQTPSAITKNDAQLKWLSSRYTPN